jgi:formylglycine-generating enzyme required for sulfatase activity
MAQNGNVWEWGESALTAPNDSAGNYRPLRGGFWIDSSGNLASSFRNGDGPAGEGLNVGFRVAAIPEPSGVLLTLIGMMGVVLRRKRG